MNLKNYQKFFASAISWLVALLASWGLDLTAYGITDANIALAIGALGTLGVLIFPNIDEKGQELSDKVDDLFDWVEEIYFKVGEKVDTLPDNDMEQEALEDGSVEDPMA